MGSTNLLLETVSKFIKLSPYRPFGTYIFCTGNGKLVVLRNPEAVLQVLFYSIQLSSETDGPMIVHKCLNDHFGYQNELESSLHMQCVSFLDELETISLGADGSLDDLGLSAGARLCVRAAGEFEKQKQGTQVKIGLKVEEIKTEMRKLKEYRALCEHSVGYYNAFILQDDKRDFEANVSRLVLAGIWDEIIEMLKRYDLPDEFEAIIESRELGTKYCRLVEPLDIANYYRHFKDEDTGPYMTKGRPKRYKYTQRWLEHEQKLQTSSCGESCFWAEVEELHKLSGNDAAVDKEKERALKVQAEVSKWILDGTVGKDVLLKSSTFTEWWQKLPSSLKLESVSDLMNDGGSMQMQY